MKKLISRPNAGTMTGKFTTQPITIPAANNGSEDSGDWFRLPRPKQRLWGLSRTTWGELCADGKVKFIVLRKKHAQRGIKLIFRPSAEAYLKSLMNGAGNEAATIS